jgi:hypothetical protein
VKFGTYSHRYESESLSLSGSVARREIILFLSKVWVTGVQKTIM